MPVAVAPVDRQRNVVGGEVGTNGGEQLAALVVDRAPATEAVVVLPHLREPFGWDTSATGDVLQERDHVVRTLRPAKRQEQQRVVGHPVPIHPSWHPLKAGMRGTFTRRFYGLSSGCGCLHEPEQLPGCVALEAAADLGSVFCPARR